MISQPGAVVAGLSGPPQLWGEVSPLWATSQNLWGVKPKNMLCEPEKSDHHVKPLDLSPHGEVGSCLQLSYLGSTISVSPGAVWSIHQSS